MQFQQSARILDIGPTLGALRQRLQDIARNELSRQRHRLGDLSPDQERSIEALLIATVNKISHPILNRLKRTYDEGGSEAVQAWRDSFGLESDGEEPEPNETDDTNET
jgi:glutamyl-tRNA reductase